MRKTEDIEKNCLLEISVKLHKPRLAPLYHFS